MSKLSPRDFLAQWKRIWAHMCTKLKGILALDADQFRILQTGQVVEVAASIPFWAGCPNPLRKAYYIALTLVADAIGHDILDATDGDYADDKLRRIEEVGLLCAQGDKERVTQGLNRLAAVMYWDCLQDLELDDVTGKRAPDRSYAESARRALAVERKKDAVYDKIMPKTELAWWWGPGA